METSELLYTLLDRYATLISYNASGNPEYIGESQQKKQESDYTWRISKITYDSNGNPTNIKWANGVSSFTNRWDNKANYTYS